MINLNNVSKTFYQKGKEIQALKPTNLHVKAGEIFGIIGYSGAGKSTLLNKYLNEKGLLKVNSEAETAVPCELKYSTDEKTLVHKTNGEVISKPKNYNVRAEEGAGIEYLEKFLNNRKLKELGDMILVDMPGLDSSNDVHEEAINKYINAGAYYILLTDPENGGIKDSTEKGINKFPIGIIVIDKDRNIEWANNFIYKNIKVTKIANLTGISRISINKILKNI